MGGCQDGNVRTWWLRFPKNACVSPELSQWPRQAGWWPRTGVTEGLQGCAGPLSRSVLPLTFFNRLRTALESFLLLPSVLSCRFPSDLFLHSTPPLGSHSHRLEVLRTSYQQLHSNWSFWSAPHLWLVWPWAPSLPNYLSELSRGSFLTFSRYRTQVN